jgi:hypothetical protein
MAGYGAPGPVYSDYMPVEGDDRNGNGVCSVEPRWIVGGEAVSQHSR